MEYEGSLKRKDVLTQATTWMNLEDILRSEISQSQKDECCMIPLCEEPRVVKFVETESRVVVARCPRGEGRMVLLVVQPRERTYGHRVVYLKMVKMEIFMRYVYISAIFSKRERKSE